MLVLNFKVRSLQLLPATNAHPQQPHTQLVQLCPSQPQHDVVKNHYWIIFYLEAKSTPGDQVIKKRHSKLHTSFTLKLDLPKVLNQCWQMVKAYAGSAFPP